MKSKMAVAPETLKNQTFCSCVLLLSAMRSFVSLCGCCFYILFGGGGGGGRGECCSGMPVHYIVDDALGKRFLA